jgi:hypothetical protein
MNLKEDDVVSAIALVVDAVEPSDELADGSSGESPDGSSPDALPAEVPAEHADDDSEVTEEQ